MAFTADNLTPRRHGQGYSSLNQPLLSTTTGMSALSTCVGATSLDALEIDSDGGGGGIATAAAVSIDEGIARAFGSAGRGPAGTLKGLVLWGVPPFQKRVLMAGGANKVFLALVGALQVDPKLTPS